MYNTPYFKEKDQQVLRNFIRDYPLAMLTGSFNDGTQVATQIPMLLDHRDGEWYIQGHMMRHADHYKALLENPRALAIFTGPQSYVSASWYTGPRMGSTWNYMSIHICGEVRFMREEELIAFMRKFTLYFEDNNPDSVAAFDNLPDVYLSEMLPGIEGVEIKVDDFKNVFKLSQNRNRKSYLNIIERLTEKGGQSALIAKEMEKRQADLFSTK